MKKTVSFREYETAKAEIIQGVEFKEYSELKGDKIYKTYATEKNGVFYEVMEGGIVEFWSDKHSLSRYFDDRTQEEIIAQYENRLTDAYKEIRDLMGSLNSVRYERQEYLDGMNANAKTVIQLQIKIKALEEKLSAITAITSAEDIPA